MGGEERRELIHEGLVNFQLDKGVSEQESHQYSDANIDQYAKRLPQGYSDWESALFKTGYQQDYNLSASAGNQNSSFPYIIAEFTETILPEGQSHNSLFSKRFKYLFRCRPTHTIRLWK